MPAHSYWRVSGLISGNSGRNNIAEIYFRQSLGGSNEIPINTTASFTYFGGDPDFANDGNAMTYWEGGGDGSWLAFQYAASIEFVQLTLQAPHDSATPMPTTIEIDFSDDGVTWINLEGTTFGAWTTGQVRTYDRVSPIVTEEIETNKVNLFTVANFLAPSINANKSLALAIVNFPTYEISANKAFAQAVVRGNHEIQANKAAALVVCKGRVAQPRIKVWTFTMDGHDFYVLQLQNETLVYDFSTGQWHVWGSGESPSWRAIHGIDWVASLGSVIAPLGGAQVSNVLVGDDTTGALYFLDPDHSKDDYTDADRLGQSYPFMRVVYTQLVLRGRDYFPLNGVLLTGSVGDLGDADNVTVNMKYSDDRGNTFIDAGDSNVTAGDYSTRVEWRSLGSVRQPGRLLKITDYGALTRIDGLDIPDAE